MKKLLLTIALVGALAPQMARAQDDGPITVEGVPVPTFGDDAVPAFGNEPAPTAVTAPMATVAPLFAGLKEPQGLALDSNGDIIVCDYGAGEVLRFSAAGAKKETLASGLKGPSQIAYMTLYDPINNKTVRQFLVSERKANRIVQLRNGKVVRYGGEIIEPVGLLDNRDSVNGGLYAVAHTTSKIYRLDKNNWETFYAAPDEDGKKGRYGLRCLAAYGTSLLVSDEVNGEVSKISRDGKLTKFAGGFDDPSGLAVRGDWVYVCDEGKGGKLWKVDKDGVKTLVAENLGRPRNVLLLDDKSALVSDRDGRVLKLNWK